MSIDVNVTNDLVIVTESSEDITVNVSNAAGPAGVGVPVGGSTGQVLKKVSATNYDTYWAAEGGGVPYSGATGDVNLGEYEIKAGQFTLDTTPSGVVSVGTTRWNDTIGSSETTLKGGSVILKNGVDLVARVVNKVTPNTTLTKAAYQAVKISGAQGQRLAISLAQANNDAGSADTIGLVTETIATNQEGFIMTVGNLEGINTTGSLQGETWADGDVLYLSPTTAGRLTNIKPNGSTGHIVVIGYVEYAHVNNGKIYVKIMNGWELDELHNVFIDTPLNDQVLTYETATSLWKNKTPTGGGGTTIYTGDGTLAGDRIVTSNGNSLTILGGSSNIYDANEETGLILKTSGATKINVLAFDNVGSSKLFEIRSLPSGQFDFLNRTDGLSIFKYLANATGYDIELRKTKVAGILQATGTLYVGSNDPASSNGFEIENSGTTTNLMARNNSLGTWRNILMIGNQIDFSISNSVKARITSAGRLLLGTTDESTYLLDVNGTARVSGQVTLDNNLVFSSGSQKQINYLGQGIQIFHNANGIGNDIVIGWSGAALSGSTQRGLYIGFNNTGNKRDSMVVVGNNNNFTNYAGGGTPLIFGNGLQLDASSEAVGYTLGCSGLVRGGFSGIGASDFGAGELPPVGIGASTIIGTGINNQTISNPTLYLGQWGSDSSLPTSSRNIFISTTNGVGTDIEGYNMVLMSGRSTGNATSKDIIFATPTPGSSGSTLQTFTQRWWVKGSTGSLSNVASPNASAQVQIDSTTQGFLPPRMTTTQKNAIGTPAAGLQVYDTTLNQMSYYNGTSWVNF